MRPATHTHTDPKPKTNAKHAADFLSYGGGVYKHLDDGSKPVSGHAIKERDFLSLPPFTTIITTMRSHTSFSISHTRTTRARIDANLSMQVVGWGVDDTVPYWWVVSSWQ